VKPEENRRRITRLRAEEAGAKGGTVAESERLYGPERRRQAQLNRQRMRAKA
jgi:hypothetical protein